MWDVCNVIYFIMDVMSGCKYMILSNKGISIVCVNIDYCGIGKLFCFFSGYFNLIVGIK